MLEQELRDYAAYGKLDVASGIQTIQDVTDNMLTRLEELTSVLQIIKLKNSDCRAAVSEDISKYRTEISTLSKKIITLNDVISKLQNNVDMLEKQVEKAEMDFGVHHDNKIISFLKPFLKRTSPGSNTVNIPITSPCKLNFESVLTNFEDNNKS